MAEVILSVSSVAKRGRNDFHKYDYATEADVLEAVRRGLAERQVVIVPRCVGVSIIERARDGKAPEYITTADMILTLVDGESGEVMECPWKGSGQDTGDKGLYKALTGGNKYFLLKLFMIPTGDDPEKDKQRKPRQESSSRPAQSAGAAPPPPPPADPDSDDVAILGLATELAKITGQHPEDVIKAFSHFTKEESGKVKEFFFTDPARQKSVAWKQKTRGKLERELQKAGALAALGSEEPPF